MVSTSVSTPTMPQLLTTAWCNRQSGPTHAPNGSPVGVYLACEPPPSQSYGQMVSNTLLSRAMNYRLTNPVFPVAMAYEIAQRKAQAWRLSAQGPKSNNPVNHRLA